jgi:hypothetical protein
MYKQIIKNNPYFKFTFGFIILFIFKQHHG